MHWIPKLTFKTQKIAPHNTYPLLPGVVVALTLIDKPTLSLLIMRKVGIRTLLETS